MFQKSLRTPQNNVFISYKYSIIQCETWACFDEPGILCQTDDKHMLSSWSTVLETSKGENNQLFHMSILVFSTHLSNSYSALVCCGTPVGNHCLRHLCVVGSADPVSPSASACTIRISSVKQKRHTKEKTPPSHFWVCWDYTITHKILGHEICNFVVLMWRLLPFIFKPSA